MRAAQERHCQQPGRHAPRRGLRLSALLGKAGLPPEIDDAVGLELAGTVRTGGGLVPFPLEYALYRIPVSPARHSRASGNPELGVTFQYRQDHLEAVLVPLVHQT